MLDPMTIASLVGLAINVGSTVVGHMGQAEQEEKNRKAAEEAAREAQRLVGVRQMQEQEGASQMIQLADRQARAVDAMNRVAAGEAGVTGASVDLLLADIERERLNYQTRTQRNLENQLEQGQAEKRAILAGAEGRINAVPGPNPFVTGLRIAGAGLDAYSVYQQNQPLPGRGGG